MRSYIGKEFQGQRLKVSMARRRPMMSGMRGGMPMRDGMMGRGGKSAISSLSTSKHWFGSIGTEHCVFLFKV